MNTIEFKKDLLCYVMGYTTDTPGDLSGEYVRADDVRDLVEVLKAKVAEWKEEAEFLTTNSVGSDISVGNTYAECAKQIEAALKAAGVEP